MIVDQFNTTLSGGAAVAARRLHQSLLNCGIDSRFWYQKNRKTTAPEDQGYYPVVKAWSRTPSDLLAFPSQKLHKFRFKNAMRNRPEGFEFFSSPRVFPPTTIDFSEIDSDVIHLHWVSKLIDYASFFGSIPNDFPIIWTLHDMNPFTGGCHHSDDCQLFQTSCQNCPQLRNPGRQDISAEIFNIKRDALAQKNIHIVTPSRWMEDRARSSKIFGSARSICTIRHGLDLDLFANRNRAAARKRFGIPEDQFVIGFGAASLSNRRKGFEELLRSLALLKNPDQCMGLAMGDGKLPKSSKTLPALATTGYLDDPEAVADFYAALDVFATTSMAETMGLVVAEAMASSVPVVAFAVGPIPEIVQPHHTGFLAPFGDCEQFAYHLNWLAERPDVCKELGRGAQKLALAEFDQSQRTKNYRQLYASAIETAHKSFRRAA